MIQLDRFPYHAVGSVLAFRDDALKVELARLLIERFSSKRRRPTWTAGKSAGPTRGREARVQLEKVTAEGYRPLALFSVLRREGLILGEEESISLNRAFCPLS